MTLTPFTSLLVALALVLAIGNAALWIPLVVLAVAAVNEFLAFWASNDEIGAG